MTTATTFAPTVAEATEAGFFPSRHEVEIVDNRELTDGVYRLTFYSEDAAGNIAENTLDTKKQEIGFGVDKTKPNMVVTNLESDTTYPLENLTVSLSAGDNLLLQSVVVYLDDYSKAYKAWTAEEIAAIVADQGEFTFDIPGDSTGAH